MSDMQEKYPRQQEEEIMTYKKEELMETIEKNYGFKKELIQNAELCGLWHVRFQVNGIRYYGWIAHSGAIPQLKVEGNVHPYHDEMGTPVTEEYYNRHIKGRQARLLRFKDKDAWNYEDTGIRFACQEEAEKYIDELEDGQNYWKMARIMAMISCSKK